MFKLVPKRLFGVSAALLIATTVVFVADHRPLSAQPASITVQFSASEYQVNETAGTATITITLNASSSNTVTVQFTTSDGTASALVDYGSNAESVIFAPGEVSRTVQVEIFDDSINESPYETVNLTLSNPVNASLGSPSTAVLKIIDDDGPPPSQPTVQFSASNYNVSESMTTATITVTLSSAPSQQVTVQYATSNGTATAPDDYTSASGTLTFVANDTSETFQVTIAHDCAAEPNETITLTLSSPSGATLASPWTATLTILDDDICLPE